MSNAKGSATITLCELYDVFKNLEEAFGVFADVLAGIRCEGLDCDTDISVDPDVRNSLEWFLENPVKGSNGGGNWPDCPASPCAIAPDIFGNRVKEFAVRTPETANAVADLLKAFSGKKITYMTRTFTKKHG